MLPVTSTRTARPVARRASTSADSWSRPGCGLRSAAGSPRSTPSRRRISARALRAVFSIEASRSACSGGESSRSAPCLDDDDAEAVRDDVVQLACDAGAFECQLLRCSSLLVLPGRDGRGHLRRGSRGPPLDGDARCGRRCEQDEARQRCGEGHRARIAEQDAHESGTQSHQPTGPGPGARMRAGLEHQEQEQHQLGGGSGPPQGRLHEHRPRGDQRRQQRQRPPPGHAAPSTTTATACTASGPVRSAARLTSVSAMPTSAATTANSRSRRGGATCTTAR